MGYMREDRDDATVVEIKKSGAAALKVTLTDGTEKTVAMPRAGKKVKWTELAHTLDTMPWDRIDCVDAKGGILRVIENDEDIDEESDDDISGKDAKLAKVMLSLLKSTMTECRKMFQAQMEGNARLVESLGEGMHSLQQVHELAMRVNLAQSVAGEGGGTEVMDMVRMLLPVLMKPGAAPQKQMPLPHVPRRPPQPRPAPGPVGGGQP